MATNDFQYIRSLSSDNIRVTSVGLDGRSVPNVDWINQSFVSQSSFSGSQFSNKAHLDTINQGLGTSFSPRFAQLNLGGSPQTGLQAATKDYVDGSILAGVGLTKSGSTLSVNSTLPHVTQVGSFITQTAGAILISSDVLVSNIRKSDNAGALTLMGGTSVGAGGAWLELFGSGSSGNAVIGTRTDFFIKAFNGTGFTNSLQATNAGVFTFFNTTDATSTTSAALVCSGGVGVAKNLHVGGSFQSSNFFAPTVGFDPFLRQPGLTFATTVDVTANYKITKIATVIVRVKIGTSVTGTSTGPLQIAVNFTPQVTRAHRESYVERNGTDTNYMVDVVRGAPDVISIKTRAGADVTAVANDTWFVSWTYVTL